MKLDTRTFRYLSPEDWRVLTAVEVGSKNHEVVPTTLISQLSGLRTGSNGAQNSISTLAKADLIARVKHTRYDGYRLTYGGLDYLALHAHTKSSAILHLGSQMGVGKESDIYLVTSPAPAPAQPKDPSIVQLTPATNPTSSATASHTNATQKPVQSILKIHRLGRTSFRSLARNRDYQRHRQHCSWQYLSRLSAQKEYAAMCALYDAGFPVPRPIACNRHTIVMSLVPGAPLKDVPISAFPATNALENVSSSADPHQEAQTSPLDREKEPKDIAPSARREAIAALYSACIELALRLASHGLIHGDLNEFNILVENVPDPPSPSAELLISPTSFQPDHAAPTPAPMIPHLIDFPQITSLAHPDAERYFDRDIACIKAFFAKRYHFFPDDDGEDGGPTFEDARALMEDALREGGRRLDDAIEAAGFSRKASRELQEYFVRERSGGGGTREMEEEGELEADQLLVAAEIDEEETLVENTGNIDMRQNSRSGMELTADGETNQPLDQSGAEQPLAESGYSVFDPIATSKLAKLSLHSRSALGPKPKAAAGWSI